MSGEASAALFDVIYWEILARGNERGETKLYPQELVHGQAAIETRTTVGIMVKNDTIENKDWRPGHDLRAFESRRRRTVS
jgi:hypothetical protein